MAEENKEKMDFICPLGFYQCEHMPEGITGALATFQRLMERAVGDMKLFQVIVYLDDLIVFGTSLEEHEVRLLRVLDRLEEISPRAMLLNGIDESRGKKRPRPTEKSLGHLGKGRTHHCLTKAPPFADTSKPYFLHVDASLKGLGAVLYQEHQEGLRPVAFASRKLSNSEQNYTIHQLEFLALKWAVVDKFHDYLYGARFTVRTDNNPLTYVLTTAKLNATGHRWLAALANYDFVLSGAVLNLNVDADMLSHNLPCDKDSEEWESVPQMGVRAVCQRVATEGLRTTRPRLVEQLGATPECIPDVYAYPTQLDRKSGEFIFKVELVQAQEEDVVLGQVLEFLADGVWTEGKSNP
ncbi:hypothetical protein AOLI_G00217850 [Acnodon oligacanthus]